MDLGNLEIPQVVQENLSDIIKLYVRYGPDYTLISKEFYLMVQTKISTKFITRFCFELNKKTYALIVDYLQRHKDSKGEGQINYKNLWPEVIKDDDLIIEIVNIPTKILKSLNKDISEAYHLLMESFSDQTLQKLFKYERIRDLYHFMTEIILKKCVKTKKQIKKTTENFNELPKKETSSKTLKQIENNSKNPVENQSVSQSEWSFIEERYLCALYMQKSLMKCCQKLIQKFGESQRWDSTKKVFKKAEEIFQKSLKKALRFSQFRSLKQTLIKLKKTKQNLIAQITKKKSTKIERYVLKFYQSVDKKKKIKSLEKINQEISILLESCGDQNKKQEEENQQNQDEQIIKEETKELKETENNRTKNDDIQPAQVERGMAKSEIQLVGSSELQLQSESFKF